MNNSDENEMPNHNNIKSYRGHEDKIYVYSGHKITVSFVDR
jgi:hypothetical protein